MCLQASRMRRECQRTRAFQRSWHQSMVLQSQTPSQHIVTCVQLHYLAEKLLATLIFFMRRKKLLCKSQTFSLYFFFLAKVINLFAPCNPCRRTTENSSTVIILFSRKILNNGAIHWVTWLHKCHHQPILLGCLPNYSFHSANCDS